MLKGIEPQRPLRPRKIGKAHREIAVIRREQPPHESRVQVHQGFEQPGLAYGWKERSRAHPQEMRLHGKNVAVKRVTPEYHEIRVQLPGNVQHRGSTELCRRDRKSTRLNSSH